MNVFFFQLNDVENEKERKKNINSMFDGNSNPLERASFDPAGVVFFI